MLWLTVLSIWLKVKVGCTVDSEDVSLDATHSRDTQPVEGMLRD